MSLHYLMKLEILSTQVIPLHCKRKKLQNLSHLNCGLKFARFEYSRLQRVGILQENVYKTRITDLDELKQRLRTERAKLDHVVMAAAIRQWRCR